MTLLLFVDGGLTTVPNAGTKKRGSKKITPKNCKFVKGSVDKTVHVDNTSRDLGMHALEFNLSQTRVENATFENVSALKSN